jgi:hypothetical protein
MPHGVANLDLNLFNRDPRLLHRVTADLRSFKRRTSVYCAVSLAMVLAQTATATASTVLGFSGNFESSFTLSAITALLVGLDGTVGIRERAASAFATVQRLEGIRLQLTQADGVTSWLWQEYSDTHSFRRVSYIEGIFLPLF